MRLGTLVENQAIGRPISAPETPAKKPDLDRRLVIRHVLGILEAQAGLEAILKQPPCQGSYCLGFKYLDGAQGPPQGTHNNFTPF